jgi:WD40 repeat protein
MLQPRSVRLDVMNMDHFHFILTFHTPIRTVKKLFLILLNLNNLTWLQLVTVTRLFESGIHELMVSRWFTWTRFTMHSHTNLSFISFPTESLAVSMSLSGHSNWVSSVCWSPNSEYALCSGSYDSTVRVWDIRSKGSLFTIQEEDKKDKVYSVHWDGDKILSGGEDKKLNIHQAKIW